MSIDELLTDEWSYLASYKSKAITISNTANRNSAKFSVLPRRYGNRTAIASFLVNSANYLEQIVHFFDGKVETIYVDVEKKQAIDLYANAKSVVKESKLVAMKPNDMTIEACDLLVRHHFSDDLLGKNIVVIGTGNLASKIALRLAERRANVYIEGRMKHTEQTIIDGINSFLPAFTQRIKSIDQRESVNIDVIISFLSGTYWSEEKLLSHINNRTFIIDGGINNFSSSFIEKLLAQKTKITRLDVRLGLSYQLLISLDDTSDFFDKIYGETMIGTVSIVSGGYIGAEGAVIVDQIIKPTQVIGIADGMGGVKAAEAFTNTDFLAMETVQESINCRDLSSVSVGRE